MKIDQNLEQLLEELTVEELEQKIAPNSKKCGPGETWNPQTGQCEGPIYYILPPSP